MPEISINLWHFPKRKGSGTLDDKTLFQQGRTFLLTLFFQNVNYPCSVDLTECISLFEQSDHCEAFQWLKKVNYVELKGRSNRHSIFCFSLASLQNTNKSNPWSQNSCTIWYPGTALAYFFVCKCESPVFLTFGMLELHVIGLYEACSCIRKVVIPSL